MRSIKNIFSFSHRARLLQRIGVQCQFIITTYPRHLAIRLQGRNNGSAPCWRRDLFNHTFCIQIAHGHMYYFSRTIKDYSYFKKD
ncbi:unnamed protein product [Schistosoma bovis]|nr:unnamed protein product [Schistosoma bovis]